jgi:hypothetical protein
MMLSSPPFQVTAMQRSFSARTALMLGKALTTLIPSDLAGPIPIGWSALELRIIGIIGNDCRYIKR